MKDRPKSPGTHPQDQETSPEVTALQLAGAIGISKTSLILGVLEQSEDCIKMLNCDGELNYMNCGGLAAMQIPDFNMVSGRKWWDLWPEDSQPMIRDMFAKCMCGVEVTFDAACPTFQGEPRCWVVKLKPMLTPDARVSGILCTSRDVT